MIKDGSTMLFNCLTQNTNITNISIKNNHISKWKGLVECLNNTHIKKLNISNNIIHEPIFTGITSNYLSNLKIGKPLYRLLLL